jgi:hypothetical protein
MLSMSWSIYLPIFMKIRDKKFFESKKTKGFLNSKKFVGSQWSQNTKYSLGKYKTFKFKFKFFLVKSSLLMACM